MVYLLVSHTSDLYGAERSLYDLACGLKTRGICILVLCPDEGPLAQKLRHFGVPVIIFNLPRPKRALLSMIRFFILWGPTVLRLAQNLRTWNISVVYNNTIDGLYAPFAARLVKVPCVWHIREVKLKNWRMRRFFVWLLNTFSSQIVFNSKATMRAYLTTPSLPWKVVYNGFEVPEAIPGETEKKVGVTVGFAGQMTPMKRPEHFLEVFAEAKKVAPNINALMAGDGPLLTHLETRIKQLNLAESVKLLGYTNNIPKFLMNIDLLVLTSEQEAFGRILVEAMAFRRPVIASRVDGIPEIVQDGICGYLVEPEDIPGFAGKIAKLAQDPELRTKMGQAAYNHVKANFSMRQYIDQLAHILEQAVSDAETKNG